MRFPVRALDDVSMASLPTRSLPALAPLRTHAGLEATAKGERLWLRWRAGDEEVFRCLLPIPGVVFYTRRENGWNRLGESLPAFDAPATWDGRPLLTLLSPAPVEPIAPALKPSGPVAFRLVRDPVPRPASALRCPLAALVRWADVALTADIESLRAARLADAALLLGERLPPIPDGERYWGGQVLTPLGFRPDPALPESALRSLLGLGEHDVALLGGAGAEIVPGDALQPLTRAGVRLALSA
jgi:hypothetical protein